MTSATGIDGDNDFNGDEKERNMNEVREATRLTFIKRFAPLVVIVAGLGIGYATGLHTYLSLDKLVEHRDFLKAYVADHTLSAALVFLVTYTTAVAFSFPAASILTIFAGFLFGWLLGGALTAVAATCGASILFLAARTAFADVLRQKAGPRVAKLADGFRENAFSFLLVIRLAPIFPFFVINVAPALFGVHFTTYVAATFLGILPGTFAYAYLGQGLDSVILSAAQSGDNITVGDLVTPELTIAFAALAAVAAIPFVVRKLRGGQGAVQDAGQDKAQEKD